MRPSPKGFTLIEMSIVLVIIGLIVGGILVGQELIAGAKIRAQVSQITQLAAALNTFRNKYDAMPGDLCANASKFGLLCGNAAGSRDNGVIDDQNSLNPIHGSAYEPIFFFGHLVGAGLLAPNYLTGTNASGTACVLYTTASANPYSGYLTMALNPQYGMIATSWNGGTWVWLAVSDCGTYTVNTLGLNPVMTPPQAYAIDLKMDDGVPSTGNTLAFTYNNSTQLLNTVDVTAGKCVTTAAATTYNITNNTLQCRLLIKLQ